MQQLADAEYTTCCAASLDNMFSMHTEVVELTDTLAKCSHQRSKAQRETEEARSECADLDQLRIDNENQAQQLRESQSETEAVRAEFAEVG